MTVQIWLGDSSYSHFEKGLAIFDKDHVERLDECIHLGMLVDSTLIGTTDGMNCGDFLIRWKISEDGIHIYDVDPKITHILFVNFSKRSIFVDGYEIKRKRTYTLQLK
ncbi:MAG: hypothetical protein IKJ91_07065 [Clostridia bacterium]|nr:hypothetical protein [Clostridia bacterium]